MTVSATPRLNLGQIRAQVRELTGVFSTDVFSDVRINKMVNDTLYSIIKVADNLASNFYDADPGTNYGKPVIVQWGAVYGTPPVTAPYRFPGWRFDNPANVGGTNTGQLKDYIYLVADTDKAPWEGPVSSTGIGGYYDNCLVYKVTADLLKEINDDTNRAEYFLEKYKEIVDNLVRDEFVEWNDILSALILTTSANYQYNLAFRVLRRLDKVIGLDTLIALMDKVRIATSNSINEFYFANTFEFAYAGYNTFANPHFAVLEAAAKVGTEYGVSESIVQGWLAEAQEQKQLITRLNLKSSYTNTLPTDLTTIVSQVRGMVDNYTRDLPDAVIKSLIDDAYMSLCYERNWSFLDRYTLSLVQPGINRYALVGDNIGYNNIKRVKNIIKTPDVSTYELNWFGSSKSADKLDRVPHILDGENNNSKYRYDLKELPTLFYYDAGEGLELFSATITNILVTPTPDEAFWLRTRFTQEPISITQGGSILFDDQFIRYLVYATVLNVIAFTGAGDKKLLKMYAEKTEEIKSQMYRYYELDAGSDSFQLGETGLTLPKYIPHFRVG